MSSYSSRDLYSSLNGRTYATYADLRQEFLQLFQEHAGDFPPQYTLKNLIELGFEKAWIRDTSGHGYMISFAEDEHSRQQQSA